MGQPPRRECDADGGERSGQQRDHAADGHGTVAILRGVHPEGKIFRDNAGGGSGNLKAEG